MARAFSATGKAILAGGYLVLFPQYQALVVALSARMHAVVEREDASADSVPGVFSITVHSPQFLHGCWSYTVRLRDVAADPFHLQLVEKSGRKNPFVEATISTVLAYALGTCALTADSPAVNVSVKMFSDPEYHTKDGSVAHFSSNGTHKFLYHEKEITKVNKTGLGSSAGLVTSLTAALLSELFAGEFEMTQQWKERVHNLAQVAHCHAQGKIGSGFDVASATFGSIVYQRFDAKLINDIIDLGELGHACKQLATLVNDKSWNMVHEQCSLPHGVRLLMGDVKGGSETPKMVSKVLQWKNADPEHAEQLWSVLNSANTSLMDALRSLDALAKQEPDKYHTLLSKVASQPSNQVAEDTTLAQFQQIALSIKQIRKCLQTMTAETGAAIEPASQTQLIDAVSSIEGVLGGVVPGAGGYDAICMLVASAQVDHIVSTTKKDTSTYGNVRWMDLTEQKDGLLEESPLDFAGLPALQA